MKGEVIIMDAVFIIIVVAIVLWWLDPDDEDDKVARGIAARDKARHDERRRSAQAYRANRDAEYRAKFAAANERSRRAMVDAHNAKVEAARRNPHSSYADRSYWGY